MLCALPTSLSGDILGRWIGLKALVRLDSAHCTHADRHVFESLLSSREYVFCDPVAFSTPKSILWLHTKGVQASSVIFGVYFSAEMLSDYLRKCGPAIRAVQIGPGSTIYEMHLLAIHCKNLKSVTCNNFTLEPAFKELLWCNPNIEEIWLDNMDCSSSTLFDEVSQSKLSTLCVRKSLCDSRFSLPVTSVNDTLQKLQLGSDVSREVIMKIIRLSPALKSLSLRNAQLHNDTLMEVCSLRPNLLHLDVSNNQILDSNGVLGMVQKLKMLRSISLHSCGSVTDRSIKNLAIYCGKSLTVAHLDVKRLSEAYTIDKLQYFSHHCRNLHSLNIHCKKGVLCLAGGTYALLHHLPALRTLVVESEEVICVSSRRFLEATHPKLQIVVEDAQKHVYDALSMPI